MKITKEIVEIARLLRAAYAKKHGCPVKEIFWHHCVGLALKGEQVPQEESMLRVRRETTNHMPESVKKSAVAINHNGKIAYFLDPQGTHYILNSAPAGAEFEFASKTQDGRLVVPAMELKGAVNE